MSISKSRLKWNTNNPDKVKEQNRKYRTDNDLYQTYGEANRAYHKKHYKRLSSSPRQRYNTYKTNARIHGHDFKLTFEDHFTPNAPNTFWQKPCHYCGRSVKLIGIDRVNNDKGYLPSNCVSCCDICQRAKMAYTLEEFEAWIIDLTNYISKRPLPYTRP